MAELDFEIHGKEGEISAFTFREAVARAVALLQEFDSAISERPRGSLLWYIRRLKSNGNLVVGFRSRIKPARNRQERVSDVSSAVTSSFLTGFADLENKCETPPYLSEYGLQKAGQLTGLIGKNGATGFRFASADQAVEVTRMASENIGKLLPIRRKAVGSVEGKLEAINLHGHPRVIVYHSITKKAVTCEFQPDEFIEQVKESLGKRVVVSGVLHKNVNGDTLRVTMERLRLADDRGYATLEETDSAEPEFVKAGSTAEYIRRIRGGG